MKQVILFEPMDSPKLYESHIPQATLSYDASDHSFRRQTLEDSTSMVMSPVDLLNPDFEVKLYFFNVIVFDLMVS
jgi:jumonji domain-containing protein 7